MSTPSGQRRRGYGAPSEQQIARMEDARWRRFARRHAHESDTCAELAGKRLDQPLTKSEVQDLASLARLNGWPYELAGKQQGRRRPKQR